MDGARVRDEDFEALFASFQESAFRLETRDRYTVDEEALDLAAFLAGRPLPARTPQTDPWLASIATATAAGKQFERVHIVTHPLNDYLRFELASYRDNAAAGELIRIADRDAHPDLAALTSDFWMFDAASDHPLVVVLHYDPEGRFLGASRAPDRDLNRYRRARHLAWTHAVPLDRYLEHHTPAAPPPTQDQGLARPTRRAILPRPFLE